LHLVGFIQLRITMHGTTNIKCTSSRFEGSFCLHLQDQTIQKHFPQALLFQSFPSYWPVADWLTDRFSACWLIKWLAGCITARFVCLLEWLMDRVLYGRPVVWFFYLKCFLPYQLCVNNWLTGINHDTKFGLIDSYSFGTRICYIAGISILLSNQPTSCNFSCSISHSSFLHKINF